MRLDWLLNSRNFPLLKSTNCESKSIIVAKSKNSDTRLWELTEKWCEGKLSNLDYLLKLNEFSGNFLNKINIKKTF